MQKVQPISYIRKVLNTKKRVVYFIPGMGADERTFSGILLDNYDKKILNWIEPLKNETIENYAKRLSEKIDNQDSEPVIIGVSFGGILAIEVAKHVNCKKIIIISSIKNKFELPYYYKFFGKIRLHKLIPAAFLINFKFIAFYLFGITKKSEKELLKNILNSTDKNFLIWAINEIVRWKNIWQPEKLFHIHGTKDKILPIIYIGNCLKLDGGQHFMIVSKAKEISILINNELNKL